MLSKIVYILSPPDEFNVLHVPLLLDSNLIVLPLPLLPLVVVLVAGVRDVLVPVPASEDAVAAAVTTPVVKGRLKGELRDEGRSDEARSDEARLLVMRRA